MNSPGARTFVGFGFGAIQAGLFLLEAELSGAFGRLVVAEVVPEVATALRAAGGYFTVNVAHADGIEAVRVGPVELCDPAVEADRRVLIQAIAEAREMATAVPSVRHYASDAPGSIHRLLAAGLERKVQEGGPPALLYAAENHNFAADLLREAVARELNDPTALERVCFANTVISKMSGVPARDDLPAGLAPVTPGSERTFLVEAFNRILHSPARLPDGTRLEPGIGVFIEKQELLPFEEAKLYVHNALHAMAGYLGEMAGLVSMAQLPDRPGILAITRRAVLEESGAALVLAHAGLDPLFTQAGMVAYVDDLFARMMNPWLDDRITRVGRDAARKLAWDDRLIGAMRKAMGAGLAPDLLALGAAAALQHFAPEQAGGQVLAGLWQRPDADAHTAAALCARIERAQRTLDLWRAAGFPDVDPWSLGVAAARGPSFDSTRTRE